MTSPIRLPAIGALVAGRAGDLVGLGVQHPVEDLGDLLGHHPVEFGLEHGLVDLYDFLGHGSVACFSRAVNGLSTGIVHRRQAMLHHFNKHQQICARNRVLSPVVDADTSALAWSTSESVSLDEVTDGSPQATATAKVAWKDNTLHVLVDVVDPDINTTASSPWEQDSVEVYIDRGNTKSASYSDLTQQIRVSADGLVTYGSGASTEVQESMVRTAAARTSTGYAVEMSIDMGEAAAGDYAGVDFQISDASGGSRIGIRNWANLTGDGYATPAHWGVLRLVEPASDDSNDDNGDNDTGEGTVDNGNGDNSTGDNDTDVNAGDEGTGDNGATDNGAGDDGATDNGAGDNGDNHETIVDDINEPTDIDENDGLTGGSGASGTDASQENTSKDALANTGVDVLPVVLSIIAMAVLSCALTTLSRKNSKSAVESSDGRKSN